MTRLLAVLAFALVASSCGDTVSTPATPTPPVTPPPVTPQPPPPAPLARLRITVDDVEGSAAIAELSTVKLDASGSSGDGLRFGLDFGDGSGADQPTATHVYNSQSDRTVRVIITDSLGRTDSASAIIAVRTLGGTWINSYYNPVAKRYETRRLVIRTSAGASLSGTYTHQEGWTTDFGGQYGPSRRVSLNLVDGTISFSTPASGGFNSGLSQMTMAVRGGSADGQTLVFDRSSSNF